VQLRRLTNFWKKYLGGRLIEKEKRSFIKERFGKPENIVIDPNKLIYTLKAKGESWRLVQLEVIASY